MPSLDDLVAPSAVADVRVTDVVVAGSGGGCLGGEEGGEEEEGGGNGGHVEIKLWVGGGGFRC